MRKIATAHQNAIAKTHINQKIVAINPLILFIEGIYQIIENKLNSNSINVEFYILSL